MRLRPADRRVGRDRRAPARPHVPAAGRRVPAVPHRPRHRPSEIPATDYDVVVFENRFPSFSSRAGAATASTGDPLLAERPAHGRCEVVCFTSDHDAAFASLSPARARTVIEAWADRTAALSALARRRAGLLLREPRRRRSASRCTTRTARSTPTRTSPPRTRAAAAQARAHHERTGRPARRRHPRGRAPRRAAGRALPGEHWTAYVPFAARWPVEVHLAPHRDVPDLAAARRRRARRAGRRLPATCCGGSTALRRRGRRPDRAALHRRRGTRRRCARAATSSRLHLQVMSRCCARRAS